MILGFDTASSRTFFDDVPEEDELPFHFQIPGPIPDFVDLYSLPKLDSYSNTAARVSLPDHDDDDDDDDDAPIRFVRHRKPSPRGCKRSNRNTTSRVSMPGDDQTPTHLIKNPKPSPRACERNLKRKTIEDDDSKKNKKPTVFKRSVETHDDDRHNNINKNKIEKPRVFKKSVETFKNNDKKSKLSRVSEESKKRCSKKPRVSEESKKRCITKPWVSEESKKRCSKKPRVSEESKKRCSQKPRVSEESKKRCRKTWKKIAIDENLLVKEIFRDLPIFFHKKKRSTRTC